jgi:hypothetical protein
MTGTPFDRLIRGRMNDLGVRSGRLAARLGYRNISKGARRLEEVCRGDLVGKQQLLANLPGALGLPDDVVAAAIEETRQEVERARQAELERAEAEWRRRFRPHALITTEREVPSPIFLAVFIGPEVLKRVDFDPALPVEVIHQREQEVLRRRLGQWNGEIIAFGKATGYVLNWEPDRAERYDLAGHLLEVLERAERLDDGSLSFGRQVVEGPTVRAVIGSERRIEPTPVSEPDSGAKEE